MTPSKVPAPSTLWAKRTKPKSSEKGLDLQNLVVQWIHRKGKGESMKSKTVTVYMMNDYSWGLVQELDAPNNSATVRIDKDGLRWFENIDIADVAIADMAELLNFVKSLSFEKI
jgi:hypothetical protein